MLNKAAYYPFCVSFFAPFQNTAAAIIKKKSNAFIKKIEPNKKSEKTGLTRSLSSLPFSQRPSRAILKSTF